MGDECGWGEGRDMSAGWYVAIGVGGGGRGKGRCVVDKVRG